MTTDAVAVDGFLAHFGANDDGKAGDGEVVFDDFDSAGIVKSAGLRFEGFGDVEIFAETVSFVEHRAM